MAETFREYQAAAARTRLVHDRLHYAVLGLTEEAGEVAGQVKRAVRDDDGTLTESRKSKLVDELGDVLWYVAALCDDLGVSLAEVAARNVQKLADRQARKALKGEGSGR